MKASVDLREGQKPLVRAKIPLNILGFPFISGVNAGTTKELCLHLATFWDSGPTLKFQYKPNDRWNPFSLILKTGTGQWGSPSDAFLTMTAEINLVGRGSPLFRLQFKPRLGDFTLRQSARSSVVMSSQETSGLGFIGLGSQERLELAVSGLENEHKLNGDKASSQNFDLDNGLVPPNVTKMETDLTNERPQGSQVMEDVKGMKVEKLLSGMSFSAFTSMSVRKHCLLKLRWGLKVPSNLLHGNHSGFSLSRVPFLCLQKISIENVEQLKKAKTGRHGLVLPLIGDETEELDRIRVMCFSMKNHLHSLEVENRKLKKAIEDMGTELQHRGFHASENDNQNTNGRSNVHFRMPEEGSLGKERPWESSYKEGSLKKTDSKEPPKKDLSKMPKVEFNKRPERKENSGATDIGEDLRRAIREASGDK
eukprot:TRINITY_DN1340_c0_g2_i1.p1 TRINITY_DN1340_c0_g2~~TRINITY_DN1340_c0_g2_i1.p1  ORF type:complete len:423 (+),score=79.65 TRINITY_DN1340_c0_g2_i1:200-1468(+)